MRPTISYSIVRRTSMIMADTAERVSRSKSDSPRKVTFSRQPRESTPLLTHVPESPFTHIERDLPPSSGLKVNSLKCCLAYSLTSLFVLSPLANLFGTLSSKHQVSTVSIYFHPARTVGAMIQAYGYVLSALLYGLLVGFTSMLLAHLLIDLQWFELGLDILLFLFCGIAFSVLAYFKISIANPTFDTACTVAIIFMVTIVIKEDNIQNGILSTRQLFTYLSLVLTGTSVSALVCFLVKPAFATVSLITALIKLMDDINICGSYIFNAFVQGRSVNDDKYEEIHARMVSRIIDINTHLGHSRFELLATGQKARYKLLEEIVNSHLHLVRHIGGLAHTTEVLGTLLHNEERVDGLFEQFVNELGPPINSFATTLNDIMSNLPFDHTASVAFNPIYLRSLKAALQLYSEARENALYSVYGTHSQAPQTTDSTDEEAVIATCGNFSYLLEELGDEVFNLLTHLVNYETETECGRKSLNWRFLISLPLIVVVPKWFQPSKKGKPFSKVSEALYPKKKVPASTFRIQIWKVLQGWHQNEIRFAFKVGFGSVILSLAAFNDTSRPVFRKWKGEWALIIYLIIMNRDLGSMTTTIKARLMGTVIGAVTAIVVWLICNHEAFLFIGGMCLSALGFLFILGDDKKKSSLGRFSLIAYNLVALSNFTKKRLGLIDPRHSIYALLDMAFHRVIAVSVGVIWALLITVCVFPDSARSAFRRNLSIQWMRMGMVWKANPLATMPRKDPTKPAEFRGTCGEEELQQGMVALKVRLQSASREFRLKGKFNPARFETLLTHTQAILNAYYSMGVIVSKSPAATSKELELIAATRQEIHELCSTLFLYFYTASSSIRMGFPVPQELPRPQHALHRLLRILQTHRKQLIENPDEDADMEDFVLFYSYILITITVTDHLTAINKILGDLFGGLVSELFTYT